MQRPGRGGGEAECSSPRGKEAGVQRPWGGKEAGVQRPRVGGKEAGVQQLEALGRQGCSGPRGQEAGVQRPWGVHRW